MATLNECRICSGSELVPVIDLGEQPWANNFLTKEQLGTEQSYPLRVVFCETCKGAQLDYTVAKETMFSNHTYLSGMTQTLSDHFRRLAHYCDESFGQLVGNKSVLDIGSNDGTQLKHYQDLGWEVLGVESSSQTAQIAIDNGIPTLNKFFNEECLGDINQKFGLINASGVFFHLEELHSVTSAVKLSLNEKGIFVVQFLYVPSIFQNDAFDQIYHEHLLYYTLSSLSYLLRQHGLEIFDAYLTDVHGGQMIAFVGHEGERQPTKRLEALLAEEDKTNCNTSKAYTSFAERIIDLRERNLSFLQDRKDQGKTIYGMGAPVKGNTLLNYFDIGTEFIDCLVEKNSLRKDTYSPGKHLPVILETELSREPDVYFVLAWNFKKEILSRYKKQIEAGVEFYFPIMGD